MPYTKNNGPDAPTGLAAGDSLRTNVYYLRDSNTFAISDRKAEPTFFNAVIVKQHHDGTVEIEPFEGQPYLAVVRVLENYLAQPWFLRISSLALGLTSSLLAI